MYSVFNYFKKVEKLEKVLDLQTPMSFVDVEHPSVKERFRRLKEKLLSDVERKKLNKTKHYIENEPKASANSIKKVSTKECSGPELPKKSRKRKKAEKSNEIDKAILFNSNVPITKLHIKLPTSSGNSYKVKKDELKNKNVAIDESKKKKTQNGSNPKIEEKANLSCKGNTKKGKIDERMKNLRNKISVQKEHVSRQKSPVKGKVDRKPALPKWPPKEPIDVTNIKSFKIPKKRTEPITHSLPILNAEEDLMEVDPPAICHEVGHVEEMDWEVNEIRKGLDNHEDNKKLGLPGNSQWDPLVLPLILVIDTNIFISSLPFVEKLCDVEVPGYGAPMIYVPRRVLCELNGLKINDKNLVKNPQVSKSARIAIQFLNSHLSNGSQRVRGQTLDQYKDLEKLNIDDSDDKILLSCLQLKSMYCDKRVMLLSNDTNLRCKAIIESVDTFSANEFEEKVLSRNIATNSIEHQIDAVLKTVFYEIISAECNIKKHYNTFKAAVDAFLSFWPNTFCYLSPVAAEESLKRLKIMLNIDKIDYIELMEISKEFLNHFRIKAKPYYIKVEKALNQVNDALDQMKSIKSQENSKHSCQALQEIFQQCWNVLQDQLTKNFNDNSFSFLSDHISKIILEFVNSINGIITCASEDYIKILANTIRICLNGSAQSYCQIVSAAIRSEEGRDLLRSAAGIFEDALRKIPEVNTLTP